MSQYAIDFINGLGHHALRRRAKEEGLKAWGKGVTDNDLRQKLIRVATMEDMGFWEAMLFMNKDDVAPACFRENLPVGEDEGPLRLRTRLIIKHFSSQPWTMLELVTVGVLLLAVGAAITAAVFGSVGVYRSSEAPAAALPTELDVLTVADVRPPTAESLLSEHWVGQGGASSTSDWDYGSSSGADDDVMEIGTSGEDDAPGFPAVDARNVHFDSAEPPSGKLAVQLPERPLVSREVQEMEPDSERMDTVDEPTIVEDSDSTPAVTVVSDGAASDGEATASETSVLAPLPVKLVVDRSLRVSPAPSRSVHADGGHPGKSESGVCCAESSCGVCNASYYLGGTGDSCGCDALIVMPRPLTTNQDTSAGGNPLCGDADHVLDDTATMPSAPVVENASTVAVARAVGEDGDTVDTDHPRPSSPLAQVAEVAAAAPAADAGLSTGMTNSDVMSLLESILDQQVAESARGNRQFAFLVAVLVAFAGVLFFRVETVPMLDRLSAEFTRRLGAVEDCAERLCFVVGSVTGYFSDRLVSISTALVDLVARLASVEAHMVRLRNGVSSLASIVACIFPICVALCMHVNDLWRSLREVTRRVSGLEVWLHNFGVFVDAMGTWIMQRIHDLQTNVFDLWGEIGLLREQIHEQQGHVDELLRQHVDELRRQHVDELRRHQEEMNDTLERFHSRIDNRLQGIEAGGGNGLFVFGAASPARGSYAGRGYPAYGRSGVRGQSGEGGIGQGGGVGQEGPHGQRGGGGNRLVGVGAASGARGQGGGRLAGSDQDHGSGHGSRR